jgi:hypothetical protein
MKLNFDFNIPNLDGTDLLFSDMGNKPAKAKQFLITILTGRCEGFDSLRAMEIASEINKKGEIDLPESEVQKLESAIRNQKFPNILEVPLLQVLNKAKLTELANKEESK